MVSEILHKEFVVRVVVIGSENDESFVEAYNSKRMEAVKDVRLVFFERVKNDDKVLMEADLIIVLPCSTYSYNVMRSMNNEVLYKTLAIYDEDYYHRAGVSYMYKNKIICPRGKAILAAQGIIDVMYKTNVIGLDMGDLLMICDSCILKCDYFVGDKESIIAKIKAVDKNKGFHQKRLSSIIGDIPVNDMFEILEMLNGSDFRLFGIGLDDSKEIRAFVMWENNND